MFLRAFRPLETRRIGASSGRRRKRPANPNQTRSSTLSLIQASLALSFQFILLTSRRNSKLRMNGRPSEGAPREPAWSRPVLTRTRLSYVMEARLSPLNLSCSSPHNTTSWTRDGESLGVAFVCLRLPQTPCDMAAQACCLHCSIAPCTVRLFECEKVSETRASLGCSTLTSKTN